MNPPDDRPVLQSSAPTSRGVVYSTVPAGPPYFQPSTATATVTIGPHVEVSTVTGDTIDFDDTTGVAVVSGTATVVTATATLTADKITVRMKEHTGSAEGHVKVENSTGTLTGTSAQYNWDGSVGNIEDAAGATPPWRFKAERMRQIAPDLYELENGELTSCDREPPDYLVRARRGKVRTGVRANMKNARLVLDETPCLYMPFYTHSLRPKKYTLRIEPGSSGRDGFTNRTTFGYPFTKNTYTKLRWDYLERTGDGFGIEHRYFNPNIRGDFDAYYIKDTNPDPQPASTRYSVLWDHYQRFTPRLTVNAKLDLKSDQTLGNQFQDIGNDVRVENQTRGIDSEAGFNYQFPRSAVQVVVSRNDRFDSTVSSSNFISQVVLPNVTYNTIPIMFKPLPFYTSFAANYTNQTVTRDSPAENLSYQRLASGTMQVKRDLKVGKKTTVTPLGSYSESWRDRTVSISSPTVDKDVYQGRYTAGSDLRQRVGRDTDLTFGYLYGERLTENGARADTAADDRGVETNHVTGAGQTRIGRDTRLTLSSAYDFRRAPRNDPTLYNHQAARVSPPQFDMEYEATRRVTFFYRETYGLYDPVARRNVRSPLNTSGEMQVGSIASKTYFSQGFSYSKPVTGATSDLILNNKIRFYPSPKWHVDLYLSYRAIGERNLEYRRVAPIEKTVQIARDLHCWVFRMRFSERPGRKEASFYIDLKANLHAQRDVFTTGNPDLRYNEIDVSQIFPENSEEPLNVNEPLPPPPPAH